MPVATLFVPKPGSGKWGVTQLGQPEGLTRRPLVYYSDRLGLIWARADHVCIQRTDPGLRRRKDRYGGAGTNPCGRSDEAKSSVRTSPRRRLPGVTRVGPFTDGDSSRPRPASVSGTHIPATELAATRPPATEPVATCLPRPDGNWIVRPWPEPESSEYAIG